MTAIGASQPLCREVAKGRQSDPIEVLRLATDMPTACDSGRSQISVQEEPAWWRLCGRQEYADGQTP
jgi:hypothetical protein